MRELNEIFLIFIYLLHKISIYYLSINDINKTMKRRVFAMLKICTIGIGNAGNQIAELAKVEKDIPGLALNSSQKDLTNVNSIPKLIVGDEKGAGKNRDEAKRFIREQIANLLKQEKFTNYVSEYDVIFVISSTGGGTGSGMAPIMTDILTRKFPDKRFVMVEVYPPIRESIAAQQNSIDYLKEVKEFLPNISYMCYDNNKYAQLPTSEMMKLVNHEIVEHMAVIRGDYLYPTPFNSIDEKDMLKILETPGRLAIYDLQDIKEKDLDEETVEDKLINIIKNVSSNVELDRDKIVKRTGVITNLNENLNKLFNTNMPRVKELIGEPVEGFEHISLGQKDDVNSVFLILSGLSVPDDRLEKIMQRIEEALDELNRLKESSVLDSARTDTIKELRDTAMKSSSDFDLEDIFNRYK